MSAKQQIIAHHLSFIHEIQKFEGLTEQILRRPIQQGKWSIIEIIGHFTPWDQFILNKRIPYLLANEPLPKGPSANEFNALSSRKAKSDCIQYTIEAFIATRSKLVEMLDEIPEDRWHSKFLINGKIFSLSSYFLALIEHDLHHLKQMQMFLQQLKLSK